MTEQSRYCPSCGAGQEPDRPGLPEGVASFRVHKDFPFNTPCQECEQRFKRSMKELFRKMRERTEKKVMDIVLGE